MTESSATKMGAAPIRVHPERCLNLRHSHARCTYCTEVCPAKALSCEDREIVHDESACTGCGTCLAACPMEAFTSRHWSERHLLDAVSESDGDRVELVCARHPEAACETVRDGVSRLSVCLAALSPGLLFEAGLLKKLDLRVDACGTCELASLYSQIENTASLAASWLGAAGHNGAISLSDSPAPTVEEKRAQKKRRFFKARRADEACVSRRDFLAGFSRDGSSLFAAFFGMEPELPEPPRAKGFIRVKGRPHVARWRTNLAKAYPHAVPEPAGAALWPEITVGDECTGCGVCEQYCPNEAIRSKIKGGRLQRVFTPGLCADCALCALACPSEAIRRSYAEQARPFEPIMVVDAKAERCPRCRQLAIKSTDHLCHWCASEPPFESVMDSARQALLPASRTKRTGESQ